MFHQVGLFEDTKFEKIYNVTYKSYIVASVSKRPSNVSRR